MSGWYETERESADSIRWRWFCALWVSIGVTESLVRALDEIQRELLALSGDAIQVLGRAEVAGLESR